MWAFDVDFMNNRDPQLRTIINFKFSTAKPAVGHEVVIGIALPKFDFVMQGVVSSCNVFFTVQRRALRLVLYINDMQHRA